MVYLGKSEKIANDKNQGRSKMEIIGGWPFPTKFETSARFVTTFTK